MPLICNIILDNNTIAYGSWKEAGQNQGKSVGTAVRALFTGAGVQQHSHSLSPANTGYSSAKVLTTKQKRQTLRYDIHHPIK